MLFLSAGMNRYEWLSQLARDQLREVKQLLNRSSNHPYVLHENNWNLTALTQYDVFYTRSRIKLKLYFMIHQLCDIQTPPEA